jgi:hypothetical protein
VTYSSHLISCTLSYTLVPSVMHHYFVIVLSSFAPLYRLFCARRHCTCAFAASLALPSTIDRSWADIFSLLICSLALSTRSPCVSRAGGASGGATIGAWFVAELLRAAPADIAHLPLPHPTVSQPPCGWDNAVAESFFHALKVELTHGKSYNTPQESKMTIFEYIEGFYNRQLHHSYTGYLSHGSTRKRMWLNLLSTNNGKTKVIVIHTIFIYSCC